MKDAIVLVVLVSESCFGLVMSDSDGLAEYASYQGRCMLAYMYVVLVHATSGMRYRMEAKRAVDVTSFASWHCPPFPRSRFRSTFVMIFDG
jgi:hypothetical protein